MVWFAGSRLAGYPKVLSERGVGQALIGSVLLGGVASLPEFATAVSAAATGNAKLAVNTLLGGIGISVAPSVE